MNRPWDKKFGSDRFCFVGKKLTDKTKCIYILIIEHWWQLIIFFLFCTNWHEISVLTIHQSIYDKWNRKFNISFLVTLSPCSSLLLNFFFPRNRVKILCSPLGEKGMNYKMEKKSCIYKMIVAFTFTDIKTFFSIWHINNINNTIEYTSVNNVA